MEKINKFILVLTSFICLLPVVLALIIYDDLPDQIVMQWNLEGNPNWYAPKAVAAFGLPVFFLILNILTFIFKYKDPRFENASKPMRIITEWITPVLSVIIVPILLFMALEVNIPVPLIALILAGVIFIIFGYYMSKIKQNFIIGIKLPWTLRDSDNWDKTHKMAGILWIFCGIMLIILAFLPFKNSIKLIILGAILAVIIIPPVLYSFLLSLRKRDG